MAQEKVSIKRDEENKHKAKKKKIVKMIKKKLKKTYHKC